MSTSKLKIYIAGPISGKMGESVVQHFNEKRAILSDFGYEVYSPMTGKEYLRNEVGPLQSTGYEHHPLATDQAIFYRDRWMVGMVDVILADLSHSGKRVSIGTMFELAWGNLLHKQVIVVLPEDNIHDHAFVKQAATIIFRNIEEAYDYLQELTASREWIGD